MDVGALRSLVLELNGAAHGVPATVTRPEPDDVAIETTVIWVTQASLDPSPYGGDLQRRDRRRVVSVPVADVPTVPRGTVIVAAEPGDTTRRWRVETTDYADALHKRVVIVPETEPA